MVRASFCCPLVDLNVLNVLNDLNDLKDLKVLKVLKDSKVLNLLQSCICNKKKKSKEALYYNYVY